MRVREELVACDFHLILSSVCRSIRNFSIHRLRYNLEYKLMPEGKPHNSSERLKHFAWGVKFCAFVDGDEIHLSTKNSFKI